MAVCKVYIANTTKQNFILNFVQTGVPKLQERDIPSGTQISLDMERADIDRMIDRHRKFGVVETSEVGRNKRFSGICYRFDKPINIDQLREGVEKRGEFEDERSQNTREALAIATDRSMNKAAQEQRAPKVETTVDIIEQPRSDVDLARAPVSQRVRVSKSVKDRVAGSREAA